MTGVRLGFLSDMAAPGKKFINKSEDVVEEMVQVCRALSLSPFHSHFIPIPFTSCTLTDAHTCKHTQTCMHASAGYMRTQGMLATSRNLCRIGAHPQHVLARSDFASINSSQVVLISGGGSGHGKETPPYPPALAPPQNVGAALPLFASDYLAILPQQQPASAACPPCS